MKRRGRPPKIHNPPLPLPQPTTTLTRLILELIYGNMRIERKLHKIKLQENRIMATIQELQAAIAAVEQAVESDVAQDVEVVRLVRILIDKINANPGPVDLTAETTALAAAAGKLSGDNQAVQDALDEAGRT